MVSPAGRGRIWTRLWPGLFKSLLSCVFSPRRAPDTLSCPWFFWGGTKVPACKWLGRGTRPRPRGTHLPWLLSSLLLLWPPSVAPLWRPRLLYFSVSGSCGVSRVPIPLPGGGSYSDLCHVCPCVPASCFLIWLVFMSLLVNSVPGVCVWLCVYYPVYLSPVCWVPCRLVYSLFPGFLSVYIALSYLDVVIKDYYFEVSPRLHVPRSLPAVCTVTHASLGK